MAGSTALLLVSFSPATPLFGAAPGAERTGGPTRIALDLRVEPLARLAPATAAVPGELEEIERWNLGGSLPTKSGFSRSLESPRDVRLTAADLARPTPFRLAGGVVTRSGRGLTWSGSVRVAGAHALRLHLASVDLPAGSRIWTWSRGGSATEVPAVLLQPGPELSARGVWTDLAFGGEIWLEVEVPASELRAATPVGFRVDRVAEIVALDPEGRPLTGADAPGGTDLVQKDHPCFVDAACAAEEFPNVERARNAVAVFSYEDDRGGFFVCTGSLVEDPTPVPGEHRKFFLTANHCIKSVAEARSLAASFSFANETCDGEPGTHHRVLGASFLTSHPPTDTTVVELFDLPPEPSFLRLKQNPLPYDVFVDVLGHPHGGLLKFSRHEVLQGLPCDGQESLSTIERVGCVTGGSSGSPALDGSGGLVGVLRGLCTDGITDAIFFGRMSSTLPQIAAAFETEPQEPPPAPEDFFSDPRYPDFRFHVTVEGNGGKRVGTREPSCLPETVCVSGAIPGRSEVFIRIVGPKPNGFLWPTLVKFTTSKVVVIIRKESSGIERVYTLEGAAPGVDVLPGLFDRQGFEP